MKKQSLGRTLLRWVESLIISCFAGLIVAGATYYLFPDEILQLIKSGYSLVHLDEYSEQIHAISNRAVPDFKVIDSPVSQLDRMIKDVDELLGEMKNTRARIAASIETLNKWTVQTGPGKVDGKLVANPKQVIVQKLQSNISQFDALERAAMSLKSDLRLKWPKCNDAIRNCNQYFGAQIGLISQELREIALGLDARQDTVYSVLETYGEGG